MRRTFYLGLGSGLIAGGLLMQIMLVGQQEPAPTKDVLPPDWQEQAAEQGYLVFTKEEWEQQQPNPGEAPSEAHKDAAPAGEKPEQVQVVKEVTINIPNGYSSRDIALLLERAGVVEDAEAFERSLVLSGLSKKLRIGVYTFNLPVTHEEIIKRLTRS
jgi:hypothetical protein